MAAAVRAHGGAHSHFYLPRIRARQQQVGDIGACNQQHEGNGPYQHDQAGFEIRGDKGIQKRGELDAPVAHFRKLLAHDRPFR